MINYQTYKKPPSFIG